MKNILIIVFGLLVAGLAAYLIFFSEDTDNNATPDIVTPPQEETIEEPAEAEAPDADISQAERAPVETIGTSAGGEDIIAYHYGTGDTEVLFVGGVHGGYSYNTALVAYEMMDYFENNPDAIPEGVTATVIPAFNPDGLAAAGVTGEFAASDITSDNTVRVASRFNSDKVDLNRNFDCQWQEKAVWQNQTVSGGSAAFSEPETQALRDYVAAQKPAGAVVYYSAAGGVFASNCNNGVLPDTATLTGLYADASGYPAYREFDFYAITGDMVNWFAKQQIPAISVLLTDRNNTEWSKNKAGIDAVLNFYAQ